MKSKSLFFSILAATAFMAFACGEDNTCKVGTDKPSCEKGVASTCTATGWNKVTCTAEQECKIDNLVAKCEAKPAKCTADSKKCVGNKVVTCVKDQLPQEQNCGADKECKGEGEATKCEAKSGKCTENFTKCVNNKLVTCAKDQMPQEKECENDEECKDGATACSKKQGGGGDLRCMGDNKDQCPTGYECVTAPGQSWKQCMKKDDTNCVKGGHICVKDGDKTYSARCWTHGDAIKGWNVNKDCKDKGCNEEGLCNGGEQCDYATTESNCNNNTATFCQRDNTLKSTPCGEKTCVRCEDGYVSCGEQTKVCKDRTKCTGEVLLEGGEVGNCCHKVNYKAACDGNKVTYCNSVGKVAVKNDCTGCKIVEGKSNEYTCNKK